ncbi:MAG: creatininase family protein [Candidatus Bilamarchaeaceae archaeon]
MQAGALSWEEFRKAARGKPAILVFGALEPHGRHLPLDTDSIIPMEIARRLEKRIGGKAVFFPPVNYGCVHTLRNAGFPGAIGLASPTLQLVAKEIFSELCREGFARFLVIIGHGGNTAAVKNALKELAGPCRFRAAVVEWWRLAGAEAGHADEVEASLVLAAGHELRAKPKQEKSKRYVGEIIPPPPGMFTPSGYIGKVGGISREKGEKIYSQIVSRMEKMLETDLLLEE